MSTPPSTQHHDLYNLFASYHSPSQSTTPPAPYAILILNQPLNTTALTLLLPAASLIVCADGGANQYLEFQSSFSQKSPAATSNDSIQIAPPRNPDAIIGDLDSVSPHTLSHYRSQGIVAIIKDADQYATDFMKCLRYIADFGRRHHHTSTSSSSPTSPSDIKGINVIAFGGLDGRVDQGFSQIHHLCLVAERYQDHRTPTLISASGTQEDEPIEKETGINTLYLLSSQSLSFVLSPGHSSMTVGPISLPSTSSSANTSRTSPSTDMAERKPIFTESTGIIPLTGPASITITGFEWDVEDWPTRLGGQVSTSNHLRSEVVSVDVKEKSGMCLFTVEFVEGLRGGDP